MDLQISMSPKFWLPVKLSVSSLTINNDQCEIFPLFSGKYNTDCYFVYIPLLSSQKYYNLIGILEYNYLYVLSNKRPRGIDALLDLLPDENKIDLWIKVLYIVAEVIYLQSVIIYF